MRAVSLAIVAAMPEEIAPLRARLRGAERLRCTDRAFVGRWADRPIALVVTGDGARNARAGIEAMLAEIDVGQLLVIGMAGALTRDLPVGTLVLAARVRDDANDFVADDDVLRRAGQSTGARLVTVVTATRIADSPRARACLLDEHGGPASAAVDLESSALVRAVQARRIPWLVLRAISDGADESLPALLARCQRDGEGIRRGEVVRRALLQPTSVPALLSLRWRLGRCASALAHATARLLDRDGGLGSASATDALRSRTGTGFPKEGGNSVGGC